MCQCDVKNSLSPHMRGRDCCEDQARHEQGQAMQRSEACGSDLRQLTMTKFQEHPREQGTSAVCCCSLLSLHCFSCSGSQAALLPTWALTQLTLHENNNLS